MQGAAHGQNYDDLVAQGYRWVNVDGPYACPTKEDLREITSNPSAINKVHMVEQIRAYFLIQGALVKVIQEDRSTGMAQIRMAGITIDLWTFSKFLSKRPIADTYSVIETPEAAGLVPRLAHPVQFGQSLKGRRKPATSALNSL